MSPTKPKPRPLAPVIPVKAKDPAALSGPIALSEAVLDGKRFDLDVDDRLVGCSVKATIEGASTLTLVLNDSDGKVRRSRLFKDRKQIALRALGIDWVLAGVGKQGTQLTFMFEDAWVAELRRHNEPLKMARGKVNRPEFVKRMVDEVKGLIYVSPEIDEKHPIAKSKDAKPRKDKDDDREPGIADDAPLQFRGGRASKAQLRLAERCLDVVASHDAPEVVYIATGMVGINETGFTNPPGSSDGLSKGVFQLQTRYAGGTDLMDPEAQVEHWLLKGAAIAMGAIEYAEKNPKASPAQIAKDVWGGQGFPLSTWTRWADEAVALVDAYGGASGEGRTITITKKYQFSRGKPDGPKGENTWQASKRLGDEVGRRRFIVGNRFYYISEEDLIRSRPRATISETDDGIDSIDWDVDGRHKADELTITCRAALWKAPPGTVVVVKPEEGSLVEGRWLVVEVDRPDAFSTASTITCRRGAALLKEKREPAPETHTKTIAGSNGRVEVGSGRDAVARAIYAAAKQISDQKRPYVYGGGHGAALSSLVGSSSGLDCSSSTSLALWMADAFPGNVAQVSGTLGRTYGLPGPGEFVTVWGNDGHVFITFDIPGLPGKRFDTSQHSESGPRLVNDVRSTAGFSPRHPG